MDSYEHLHLWLCARGLEEIFNTLKEQKLTLNLLKELYKDNEFGEVESLFPSVGHKIKLKKFLKMELESESLGESLSCPLPASTPIDKLHHNVFITDGVESSETFSTNFSTSPLVFTYDDSYSIIHGSLEESGTDINTTNEKKRRSSTDHCNIPMKKPFQSQLADLNISDILKSNCVGEAIMKIYQRDSILLPKYQNYLVDIIITHILSNRGKYGHMTNECFNIIADKIIEIFPEEEKSSFYVAPVKKNKTLNNVPTIAKGKIPDKYKNKLALLKESGVISRKQSLGESDESGNSSQGLDYEIDEYNESKTWLNFNIEPQEQVLKHWKKTYQGRFKEYYLNKKCRNLNEIYRNWKILYEKSSHILIEADFEEKYPRKSTALFDNFEKFFNDVLEYKLKTCQGTSESLLVDLLKSGNLSLDSKTLIQLLLLPSFLPNKSNKLKKWKPSISESREALVLQVKVPGDIERKIKEREEKLDKLGLCMHPQIVVEASSITEVRKSYVYIEGALYPMKTLLKALDVCFKSFILFLGVYPPECEQIYYLIQHQVYDITTKYDVKIPYVLDFMKALKKRGEKSIEKEN